MSDEQPNNQTEETPIFYDCREPQKIPLLSIDGSSQSRCWHRLKPLSNERYFQFDAEVETVAVEKPRKLSEIYKPHYDLWQELFFEREGLKEKDTDVLFSEAVQAVKALLYYETVPPRQAEKGELYDSESDSYVYFGAMYSGAWLGLQIYYQNEINGKFDEYQQTQQKIRQWGLGYKPSRKAEKLHTFALPFIKNVAGYAPAENPVDVVPAWHITNSVADLFSYELNALTSKPIITRVYGR